jgi:hypothetical protein
MTRNRTGTRWPFALIALVAISAPSGGALADDLDPVDTWSRRIPYQGKIEQSGALVNGAADLSFAIFTAPSGGTAEWSEIQSGVTISK